MSKKKKKHRRAAERHNTDDEIILQGIQCFMQLNDIHTISVDYLPNGDCDVTFEPDNDYSDREYIDTALQCLMMCMVTHNLKHLDCIAEGNKLHLHGKPFTAAKMPFNILSAAAIKKHSAGVETDAKCFS